MPRFGSQTNPKSDFAFCPLFNESHAEGASAARNARFVVLQAAYCCCADATSSSTSFEMCPYFHHGGWPNPFIGSGSSGPHTRLEADRFGFYLLKVSLRI
ncbi:hypothetical protein HN011_007632 [Eciton burchellii]|nr:hypothetical protein HN011_007632 [Eciton burchellii]